MYLPKLFKSEDTQLLKEIITQNAFASMIAYHNKIISTKCMFAIQTTPESENFVLETHVSKANPIAKILKDGDPVLCDFLGAHTYISSSWYNHLNVSTWNYEAVQIYGTIAFMTQEELFQHLSRLTDNYESAQKCPVTSQKMGRSFIEKEMKGASGYKIMPTEVAIKQKMSQNRDDANFKSIIEHLDHSKDQMDLAVARKMKELRDV
jgi:transcriptional regulator